MSDFYYYVGIFFSWGFVLTACILGSVVSWDWLCLNAFECKKCRKPIKE